MLAEITFVGVSRQQAACLKLTRATTSLRALLREIPAPAELRKDWIDGMACR